LQRNVSIILASDYDSATALQEGIGNIRTVSAPRIPPTCSASTGVQSSRPGSPRLSLQILEQQIESKHSVNPDSSETSSLLSSMFVPGSGSSEAVGAASADHPRTRSERPLLAALDLGKAFLKILRLRPLAALALLMRHRFFVQPSLLSCGRAIRLNLKRV
jgi:hypothetical protein